MNQPTTPSDCSERFTAIWDAWQGDAANLPDAFQFLSDNEIQEAPDCLAVLLVDQYRRWRCGHELSAEQYFDRCSAIARSPDRINLVLEEIGYLEERAGCIDRESFAQRFAGLPDEMQVEIQAELSNCRDVSETHGSLFGSIPIQGRPSGDSPPPNQPFPQRIGRYVVQRELGQGSFGVVYLAKDNDLERDVAIKVPSAQGLSRAGGADAFLREAKLVAQLDHPNIVPVYDVGRIEDGTCFVVSKYIEGYDLSGRETKKLSIKKSVQLVSKAARAIHAAHLMGLVHRDLKPANILMDADEQPHIVDFGLAFRESDAGQGYGFVGTPAYMSPEQARGEGHRVDARSDIYSLGVILHELLTGKRPHVADSTEQLLKQITTGEIPPLRNQDPRIPSELDRICTKALSSRACDRYDTAQDFAEELETHFAEKSVASKSADALTPGIRMVPKGLRSFDGDDAEFFHELLPGPRDRTGIVDSIRFWKQRIESTDSENAFSVGVIYGPSGCGKSSFIKAGLIPVLSDAVKVVFVEATADDTERRILRALHGVSSADQVNTNLSEQLASLRRSSDSKVVIFIDQFEQWLSGASDHSSLISALRQCEGKHVQAIVMVRDDFWMATTRFMRELEVPIVEGVNSAAVDLFDLRHARKVLVAFGQAFGALPTEQPLSSANEEFVARAVDGLAEFDKVVCVRLAVFAEMVKAKPWTPETLANVGGTEGIGEAFLEESLGQNAPQRARIHSENSKAVLGRLLPENGSDIKAAMCSVETLRKATDDSCTDESFDDLLRLLDSELKLVTPTEPDQATTPGENEPQGESFYQLSHDFLVPALRHWLTRAQRATLRGRTMLNLESQSNDWNNRPEKRRLPSMVEYASIRFLTKSASWTDSQSRMMSHASKLHAKRLLLALALLLVCAYIANDINGSLKSQALLQRLDAARLSEVPSIVNEMGPYRHWLAPKLAQKLGEVDLLKLDSPTQASDVTHQEIALRMAMLKDDPRQKDQLLSILLQSDPPEYGIVLDAIRDQPGDIVERLWRSLNDLSIDTGSQRLQASAALAQLAPTDDRWSEVSESVANDLLAARAVHLDAWLRQLQPVREKLLATLTKAAANRERSQDHRHAAAEAIAQYAFDRPEKLFQLALIGDDQQFSAVAPKLQAHRDAAIDFFQTELDHDPRRWRRPKIQPDWETLSTEFVTDINEQNGFVDKWFAYVVQTPFDETFDEMNAAFAKAGYHAVRIRPYSTSNGMQVAAIWHRGVGKRVIEKGFTEQQAHARNQYWSERGYLAEDLAGYVQRDDVLYSIVWRKRKSQSAAMTILKCGLTSDEFAELHAELIATKPVPTTRQTFLDQERQQRHCMIVKSDGNASYRWETVQGDLKFFMEKKALTRRQNDLSICADPADAEGQAPQAIITGLWQRGNETRTDTWIYPTSAANHRNATVKYLEMGLDYLPVSIGAAEIEHGVQPKITSLFHRPYVSWRGETEVYRRKSNAAIALQLLGHGEPAFDHLRLTPNPTLRTFLIDRMAATGIPIGSLMKRFKSEQDPTIRAGLLLALDEYVKQPLPRAVKDATIGLATTAYKQDSAASVHSAADLVLRRLGAEAIVADMDNEFASQYSASSDRDWMHGVNGHAFSIIDADEFLMGFRANDEYRKSSAMQHRRIINRRFAIATKETTAEQFEQFLVTHPKSKEREGEGLVQRGGPQTYVTFFLAAEYCNWLSSLARIPEDQWAYEPTESGQYVQGMTIPANSIQRFGYRLPTEAEWEYACRAGTETMYFFGESVEMLPKYAWYAGNSDQRAHQVAVLRPNDFGLFDILGNGSEITQTEFLGKYTVPQGEKLPESIVDEGKEIVVKAVTSFSSRGLGFVYDNYNVTTPGRLSYRSDSRAKVGAFRVVRTLPEGK